MKEVSSELESGSQGRLLAHSSDDSRWKLQSPQSLATSPVPTPNTINPLHDLVMAQAPQVIWGLPPGVRLTSSRRG